MKTRNFVGLILTIVLTLGLAVTGLGAPSGPAETEITISPDPVNTTALTQFQVTVTLTEKTSGDGIADKSVTFQIGEDTTGDGLWDTFYYDNSKLTGTAGEATFTVPDTALPTAGTYSDRAEFDGTDNYLDAITYGTIEASKVPTVLEVVPRIEGASVTASASFVDETFGVEATLKEEATGDPVTGEAKDITFSFLDQTDVTVTTDSTTGVAETASDAFTVPVDASLSPYSYSAEFAGDDTYAATGPTSADVEVLKRETTLVADDSLTLDVGENFDVTVTLTDTDTDEPVESKDVVFSFEDQTDITATTDASGVADTADQSGSFDAVDVAPGDHTYSASFAGDSTFVSADSTESDQITVEGKTLSLTFSGDGSGTVTIDGTDSYDSAAGTQELYFATGTDVNLEATPGANSDFEQWTIDSTTETSSTKTVTMDADKEIDAEFVPTGAEVGTGNPSKENRIGGRVQGRDRLSQNAKFYRPGPKRKSCVFIHTYTHSAPGGGLVD